jgi:hypothetical protein
MKTKSRSMFYVSVLFVLLASLLGSALIATPAHAFVSTCFVDASASGTNTGSTWTNAYTDLQSALLQTGPSCAEIWVAKGVYKPDGASPGNRALSFIVAPGQAVYGGFASGDAWADRDPASKVTVLSGDIDSNDTNKDVNGVTPTADDVVGNNAYHVMKMNGTSAQITSSTVVDGFTLTAGEATGSGDDSRGGGLLCKGNSGGRCNPVVAHLMIVGNLAGYGGGAFDDGAGGDASPTVTDVTFKANKAAVGSAYPAYTNGIGGGMYNSGVGGISDPQMTRVTFKGNWANVLGGAMMNDGTAGGESSPSVTDATFDNNEAGGYAAAGSGGAIYSDGTGGTSVPLLTNVTFSENHAGGVSGGFFGFGGAMDNTSASPTLSNATFFGNTALNDGGAMYNLATGSNNTNPTLLNVTFSRNSAVSGMGGAILNHNSSGAGVVNLQLSNVVLWGDMTLFPSGGPEIKNGYGSEAVSIDHSVVQGGCASILGSGVTCGVGNLSTDPDLDPGGLANNGGYTKTVALMTGSSAIDRGDDGVCTAPPVSGFDQRGEPRPQGPHCDIGAYEKRATAPEVVGMYPVDGGSGCRRPDVGVGLLLSDLTRLGGSFDPTKVVLLLDSADVTGAASKSQTESSPASEGSVLYMPTVDLALGIHVASFTYPTAGGQVTLLWSFTVTSIGCPAAGTHGPIDAWGPAGPMQIPTSMPPGAELVNPDVIGVQR